MWDELRSIHISEVIGAKPQPAASNGVVLPQRRLVAKPNIPACFENCHYRNSSVDTVPGLDPGAILATRPWT